MVLGISLHGGRPMSWPGEVDRMIGELRRLDPWSFCIARVPESDAGDVAVVGTTGAFLIAACGREGYLLQERGRLTIDGYPVAGLREIRKGARAAEHRLAATAVFTEVEPVLCLTRAAAGSSRTFRGVRVARLDDLISEITNRAQTLRADRAVKGASVLGDPVSRRGTVDRDSQDG
jgi:hypothetical protein